MEGQESAHQHYQEPGYVIKTEARFLQSVRRAEGIPLLDAVAGAVLMALLPVIPPLSFHLHRYWSLDHAEAAANLNYFNVFRETSPRWIGFFGGFIGAPWQEWSVFLGTWAQMLVVFRCAVLEMLVKKRFRAMTRVWAGGNEFNRLNSFGTCLPDVPFRAAEAWVHQRQQVLSRLDPFSRMSRLSCQLMILAAFVSLSVMALLAQVYDVSYFTAEPSAMLWLVFSAELMVVVSLSAVLTDWTINATNVTLWKNLFGWVFKLDGCDGALRVAEEVSEMLKSDEGWHNKIGIPGLAKLGFFTLGPVLTVWLMLIFRFNLLESFMPHTRMVMWRADDSDFTGDNFIRG